MDASTHPLSRGERGSDFLVVPRGHPSWQELESRAASWPAHCVFRSVILRDPADAAVSAFYTSLGGGHHFECVGAVRVGAVHVNASWRIDVGQVLAREMAAGRHQCDVSCNPLMSMLGTASVEAARSALSSRFDFVGTFADSASYERMLEVLSDVLERRYPTFGGIRKYYPLYNYNPHPHLEASAAPDAVRTCARNDSLLYVHAAERYEAARRAFEASARSKLRSDFKCGSEIVCYNKVSDDWTRLVPISKAPQWAERMAAHGQSWRPNLLCGPIGGCARSEMRASRQ